MEEINHTPLQGLAQLLVHHNQLRYDQALHYQRIANSIDGNFLHYLIDNAILSPKAIALSIAQHYDMTFIDLDSIDITSIPKVFLSEPLLREHHVVPLFLRDNHVFVATDDPSRQTALNAVQFHTGYPITPLVVESPKLTAYLRELLQQTEHQELTDFFAKPMQKRPENASIDTPVVAFVNRILLDAIAQQASDIHFEPYEQQYRIRYRLDGQLHEITTPPLDIAVRIAARIKIMASLDISERRVPQDGRLSINNKAGRLIDCRVSTCPTAFGEKIVVRILDSISIKPRLETLQLTPEQHALFLDALAKPQGLILVTGPTGSGKTTTLYAALNSLNTTHRNISSVEDPVEITLPGINQVPINPAIGLTFSSILRAFLRQDPDILMVGEIRDLETAEIAIKAAETGHLVLSTLHTNGAPETISRLLSMGIPPYDLTCALSVIIAQRLVRSLCHHCKVPCADLSINGPTYQAQGCHRCTDGYRGRVPIFEIMPLSQRLHRIILSQPHSADLRQEAQRDGMIPLRQAGLFKVRDGITSLEEIQRITVQDE